jgi:hypothetical protein
MSKKTANQPAPKSASAMTNTSRPGGTVLTFPIPASDQSGPADPRWRRVEALYDELADVDPAHFERRMRLRVEQAFCHAFVPALLEAWDYDVALRVLMLSERADLGGPYNRTRGLCPALRQTDDQHLEDLIIELQREVEDRRRAHARNGHRNGGA